METRYAKAMEQRRSEMPRSKIMMLISSLSSDPPELSTACSGRAATASREKSGSTLPFHTAAMINVTHDHAIHHSPQVDWSAAAAASCSPPPHQMSYLNHRRGFPEESVGAGRRHRAFNLGGGHAHDSDLADSKHIALEGFNAC